MATPRGKIGRLPEALRKQINGMIRDNKTADEIIAVLESQGVAGVTPSNVSAWKKWGFEKWSQRMDRLDEMEAEQEWCQTVVERARAQGGDALTAGSDAASLRAMQILRDAMDNFGPESMRGLLAEKPEKFLDLCQALAAVRKGDQASVLLQQKVEDYERQRQQLSAVIEEKGVATKEDFDAIYREAYGVKPGA